MSAAEDRGEAFTDGYRWGLIAERQRIIAVIREHISYAVKVEDQMDGTDDVLEAEDIVALIRGEE